MHFYFLIYLTDTEICVNWTHVDVLVICGSHARFSPLRLILCLMVFMQKFTQFLKQINQSIKSFS